MLETVLTLALAIAFAWYVYTCHRRDSYKNVPPRFSDDDGDDGYPVVQYPGLPFARPAIPYTADPRVINPELASAPAQFPQPRLFGAFGVTDSAAAVWTGGAKTKYIDGEAPRQPRGGRRARTILPLRTSEPAKPVEVDFVESNMGSLRAGPVELLDANLTPPGMARPLSEWAWINYGSE